MYELAEFTTFYCRNIILYTQKEVQQIFQVKGNHVAVALSVCHIL